jgi:hypothetical protein
VVAFQRVLQDVRQGRLPDAAVPEKDDVLAPRADRRDDLLKLFLPTSEQLKGVDRGRRTEGFPASVHLSDFLQINHSAPHQLG